MSERPQVRLRVEPHMIPALRAAFTEAAEDMRMALNDLYREGNLPGPWLGDPVSEDIRARYAQRVMDESDPTSAYRCLCAYRDELAKVARALAEMEAGYRSTDDQAARRMGRDF